MKCLGWAWTHMTAPLSLNPRATGDNPLLLYLITISPISWVRDFCKWVDVKVEMSSQKSHVCQIYGISKLLIFMSDGRGHMLYMLLIWLVVWVSWLLKSSVTIRLFVNSLPSDKEIFLHYLPFCKGNQPVTGGLPSQRASNAETVSLTWHTHAMCNSSTITK